MIAPRRSRVPIRSYYAMSDDEEETRRKRMCYEDVEEGNNTDHDGDCSFQHRLVTVEQTPEQPRGPSKAKAQVAPASSRPIKVQSRKYAPPAPRKKARQTQGDDTTVLGQLAVNLSRLIQSRPDQCISIDDAAEILGENRRRLYDVVHVLGGAGAVHVELARDKLSDGKTRKKTRIHWINRAKPVPRKLAQLEQENERLDAMLQQCLESRSKWNKNMVHITKDLLLKHQEIQIAAGLTHPLAPQAGVDLVLAPPSGSVLNVDGPFPKAEGYAFQVSVPNSKSTMEMPTIPLKAFILEGGNLHSLAPPQPLLSPASSEGPKVVQDSKKNSPFVSLSPTPPGASIPDDCDWEFPPRHPNLAYCCSDLHLQPAPVRADTPPITTPALTPSSPLTPTMVTPLLRTSNSDLMGLLAPPISDKDALAYFQSDCNATFASLSPGVYKSGNYVGPLESTSFVGNTRCYPELYKRSTGPSVMTPDMLTPSSTISPIKVTPSTSSNMMRFIPLPTPVKLAETPPTLRSMTSLEHCWPGEIAPDALLLAALENMGEM